MRPIIAVGAVLGVTGCVTAAAVLRPTGAEVNTIRLREGSPRWRMHGEGPAWTTFAGGVQGLRFRVGDTFAVEYVNELSVPTLVHAHGLTPPQGLDGVPFVDAPPIPAGRSELYEYELKENNGGSYWLHSHYGFQHEKGLAIPLVVDAPMPPLYPLGKEIDKLQDVVMFLEDFCSFAKDEPEGNQDCLDPDSVYDVLKSTWDEEKADFNFTECTDAAEGSNAWDVGYRKHMANGREAYEPAVHVVEEGTQYVRLRLINGADMTNYHVSLGEKLGGTLIATDGQPCFPIGGSEWWVAVAQRMDVVVEVPDEPGAYPIRAVVEGDTLDKHVRQSVLVLVVGGKAHIPPPGTYSSLPKMPVGFMKAALESKVRAWSPLPESSDPPRRFTLNLTGDNGFDSINTHSWQLPPEIPNFTNNEHPLLVSTGDRVCITLRNFNADSHPFHLHGHHFEVVRVGDTVFRGAMRDVVMVDPGECAETEICFIANNPGVWPIHCHMTYHLAAGMMSSIEYTSVEAAAAPLPLTV